MKQNSKESKFQKSLTRSKISCRNTSTSYLFLGIIFSLSLIVMTSSAMADNHVTVTIESKETCGDSACLSKEGLIIPTHTTVTWKNNDSAPHVILSGNSDDGRDGIFESGMILPEEEFSMTFEESGYYTYYCDTHPWMVDVILINS